MPRRDGPQKQATNHLAPLGLLYLPRPPKRQAPGPQAAHLAQTHQAPPFYPAFLLILHLMKTHY